MFLLDICQVLGPSAADSAPIAADARGYECFGNLVSGAKKHETAPKSE